MAKTSEACTELTRQFAERETTKRYLAITRGIPKSAFTIDAPLKRDDSSAIELKMKAVSAGDALETESAQPALTRFKRLEVRNGGPIGPLSLVECFPETGRQHQIRVHLDVAGYPILGDKLYGMPEEEALRYYERKHATPEAQARLVLDRHALHAAGISFVHPSTGQTVTFTSELPTELREFLDGFPSIDCPPDH